MKLRFYIDLFPGINPQQFPVVAVTNPHAKSEGSKRIAFDVEIPDSLLFAIDGVAAGTSKVEVLE